MDINEMVYANYKDEILGIDKVTVNGKVYLAADKVLETIDSHITIAQEVESNIFALYSAFTLHVLKMDIEALKGGEQE